MIHPNTELRFVSDAVGYGVFATYDIPAGTIMYVKDPLELEIPPHSMLLVDPLFRDIIERYSYIEPGGHRIISWDIAKYVNHSCNYNSLSTGYGFEIAIRDIQGGEQITDDYGMFNMDEELHCHCGAKNCRGKIRADQFDRQVATWDRQVRSALSRFKMVDQPLAAYLDAEVREALLALPVDPGSYRPVHLLKAVAAGVTEEDGSLLDADLVPCPA